MHKTVICTGANGGIGAKYCAEMLRQGFHVVLACRNAVSGQALLDDLTRRFPQGSLELALIDMGSMDSIRAFADAFKAKHERLDVLAHNAGVYFFDKTRKTSKDGVELNFAIHTVGPFALTALLFDRLSETNGARVIAMTSTEHRSHPIDLADVELESDFEQYGNMEAYARSKWAVLSFIFLFAEHIQSHGLNMHALAAHPGVSITGIQHKGNPTLLQRLAIKVIGTFLAGQPQDAAAALIMASLEGKNRQFYGPTGFREMKGAAGLVEPDPGTLDTETGAALWAKLEALAGVAFPFTPKTGAR